jgi:hypothetical protein
MGAVAEVSTILVVTGVVPYFAQAPISYKQYRTLPDAYLDLDIAISFKPKSEDGLIFYNGNNNIGTADFISFGLSDNYPEFRFNVAGGDETENESSWKINKSTSPKLRLFDNQKWNETRTRPRVSCL